MENKEFNNKFVEKDPRFKKVVKDFEDDCVDFVINMTVRNTLENKQALRYLQNIGKRLIQINQLLQKEGKI